MKPAASYEDLCTNPIGKSFSGRCFVYYYPQPAINGFSMWGRAADEDMQRLTAALDSEFVVGTPPHLSFIDFRRTESIDGTSFQVLAQYLDRRFDDFAKVVQKQAIIRPAGVAGAIVAGFYDVFKPTFPARVFSDPHEALQWLGHPDTSFIAQVDSLVDEAQGIDPITRLVREALEADLTAVDLERLAKTLGMSERTLQRRLSEVGTTFQGELNAAQVRAAQRMLLESDVKLTVVALEVGCASLQHFSALFRKHTGDSPSAWREKHRKA